MTFFQLRFLFVLYFVLVSSLHLHASAVEVEVQAGSIPRHATPVSVEVNANHIPLKAIAWVRTESGRQSAQIVREEGRTSVWWIVHDLPAGKTRRYNVHVKEGASEQEDVFAWQDSSSKHGRSMDLLCGTRPVLRYMHTPFDKANIEFTKKPFHHLFSPDGSRLITKGAGGQYSHHRGIFFGYNKCKIKGESFDVWHAAKGEHQLHRDVSDTITGPILGGHVVKIDWNDPSGKPFIKEERRLIAYRQPKGELLIEFVSTLRPVH